MVCHLTRATGWLAFSCVFLRSTTSDAVTDFRLFLCMCARDKSTPRMVLATETQKKGPLWQGCLKRVLKRMEQQLGFLSGHKTQQFICADHRVSDQDHRRVSGCHLASGHRHRALGQDCQVSDHRVSDQDHRVWDRRALDQDYRVWGRRVSGQDHRVWDRRASGAEDDGREAAEAGDDGREAAEAGDDGRSRARCSTATARSRQAVRCWPGRTEP